MLTRYASNYGTPSIERGLNDAVVERRVCVGEWKLFERYANTRRIYFRDAFTMCADKDIFSHHAALNLFFIQLPYAPSIDLCRNSSGKITIYSDSMPSVSCCVDWPTFRNRNRPPPATYTGCVFNYRVLDVRIYILQPLSVGPTRSSSSSYSNSRDDDDVDDVLSQLAQFIYSVEGIWFRQQLFSIYLHLITCNSLSDYITRSSGRSYKHVSVTNGNILVFSCCIISMAHDSYHTMASVLHRYHPCMGAWFSSIFITSPLFSAR